jgi:predicted permease
VVVRAVSTLAYGAFMVRAAMEAILNVALPIFALIACGYIAGKIGVLGEDSTAALNAFVWWFALPALFVLSLAKVKFDDIFNVPFLIAYGGAFLFTYLLAIALAAIATGGRLAELSLHGIAAGFGNVGYMGIPLCLTAFGAEGALPATIAAVFGSTVMMALSVILVEIDLQAGNGILSSLGKVIRAILRNPLLIATALGLTVAYFQIELPVPLVSFLDVISKAAAPCALFAIGLFLVGKSLTTGLGEVSLAVLVKMVVQPAVAYLLALFVLPHDSVWFKAAVLLAALPTAANAFVLARQYNLFMARASGIILVSTMMSVLTLTALLVLLHVG